MPEVVQFYFCLSPEYGELKIPLGRHLASVASRLPINRSDRLNVLPAVTILHL